MCCIVEHHWQSDTLTCKVTLSKLAQTLKLMSVNVNAVTDTELTNFNSPDQ